MEDSFIIANRTDVGRVREVNEDSMVTFDSPNGRVVAVCDGMGGQAAGDVASKLACDIITDILTNNRFDSPTEAITRACIAANQAIVHKAAQNPSLEGMGATCVMVIIKDGLVYYGWVGDSRIYYITHDSIQQLTRDQSYVQKLVDQGTITAAEAENHPQKNQILNALGVANMTPPELCVAPLTPQPGSIIMLCSDGLSGMVDNHTILSILSHKEFPLQRRADMLVKKANENGGHDNITVQLVEFRKSENKASAGWFSDKKLWIALGCIIVAAIIALAIIFSGESENKNKKASPKPYPTTQTTAPAKKKEKPAESKSTSGQQRQTSQKDGKHTKKTGGKSRVPGDTGKKTGSTTIPNAKDASRNSESESGGNDKSEQYQQFKD